MEALTTNQTAHAAGVSFTELESKRDRDVKPHQSRVGIAQITTDPGNIEGNKQKIIDTIRQAKEADCKIVVFNEAAVPGYCSMDLLYNPEYIKDNLAAIQEIAKETEGITAVVGFVDAELDKSRPGKRPQLYNSAAVLHNGEILGIQDKTLIPDYEIFFENRYFSPARESKVFDVDGVKLGVTICEDIWSSEESYEEDPTKKLVEDGADLIVNLSASPFHVGKQATREELVSSVAKKHHIPVVYSNLVGGFDGYEGELIFDGHSMAVDENGELVSIGKSFEEELVFADFQSKDRVNIPAHIGAATENEVSQLHDALVLGIREYFRKLDRVMPGNKMKAIVGLSGGVDSAVVVALAVEALGADRVLGVTLPSKYSSSETFSDAEQHAANLGIELRTVPIQGQVDAVLAGLHQDSALAAMEENVAEENVQARLRMIDLMYYANKIGGIVLNTGNKTELALNNCTIYGDMVGGFGVIEDVDKDRVYDLCWEINKRFGRAIIPESTIVRPPSAELKEDQIDSDVMGDDPRVLAPMVREIIEKQLSVTETLKKYEGQFSEELILNVFGKLDASEWKRRQAAPGIRVTPHAFGNGRRMPMSHGYRK